MMETSSKNYPHKINRAKKLCRMFISYSPLFGLCQIPNRPNGISTIVRVKNEADWIEISIRSIRNISDEIIIIDNGSNDGTYEIVKELAQQKINKIRLLQRSDLKISDLSNFALNQTLYRWIFRWDGDMVAHTDGTYNILNLRNRLLALDQKRYYLIYLCHINLAGDLFHQDPNEMVHIEEYIHTFSEKAKFIHPNRYEAVKFPKYFMPLFWYEPYSFHVNVKPARRMLLRYFWEDWMELKDYKAYPTIEEYVNAHLKKEFNTNSWQEAQKICVLKICCKFKHFDANIFGPYPELLKPHLSQPKFRLIYKNDKIIGRDEG